MILEEIQLWLFKTKWFIINIYECFYKYNNENRRKLYHIAYSAAIILFSIPFLTTLTSFNMLLEENPIMITELISESIEIIEEEPIEISADQIILAIKPNISKSLLDKIVANIELYKHVIDKQYLITLISIESQFNPNAKSYTGEWNGAGLCQVSQPGLDDYNRVHGTNYQRQDLYNVDINIMIAVWIYDYNKRVYTNASDHRELYVAYNIGSGMYNSYSNLYMNGLTKNRGSYKSLDLYDQHYELVASAMN
jgi:hypothetical protein